MSRSMTLIEIIAQNWKDSLNILVNFRRIEDNAHVLASVVPKKKKPKVNGEVKATVSADE